MDLEKILKAHYRPTGLLGAGGRRRDALVADLQSHRQRRYDVFRIILLIFVVTFFLAVMATLRWLDSPESYAGLVGVLGVSASGAAVWTFRVAKDWAQADLLITLLAAADEQQVQDSLKRLLDKMSVQ